MESFDQMPANIINVSAETVSGETLAGGSGVDTLFLTTAGNVNLGGISNFSTIDLFTGNNGINTVTVTDTTLSGGMVAINHELNWNAATLGSNIVSAAGDTAASKGKTLLFYAG